MQLRDHRDITVSSPDTPAVLVRSAAGTSTGKSPSAAAASASLAPPDPQQCAAPTARPHIELYYAHFAGAPDNFAADAADIEQQFLGVDENIVSYDASHYFGVNLHLYVECDVSDNLVVHDLALSTSRGSTNFSTIVSDMQAQGHCLSGGGAHCVAAVPIHYWVWTDGNPTPGFAGQSTVIEDDAAGATNVINHADGYSVNYGYAAAAGGAGVFAHENGHAMGAVQLSAPHSTGAWHCTDGRDVMCYNDGGPYGSSYTTSDCGLAPNGTVLFDCGFNDYFNPAPAPGTYLATHWNVGSPNNTWLDFQQLTSNTTLSASTSAALYGEPVQFTATVSGASPSLPVPSGTVTFLDGGESIGTATLDGTGQAVLQTGALALGSHSITATFAGSGEYASSESAASAVMVSPANTNTVLSGTPNPSTPGQSVTLTASVTAAQPSTGVPTGSVTFYDDGKTVGTSALDGSGRAVVSASWSAIGSQQLTATYAGSSGYVGSTSSVFDQSTLYEATTTVASSLSSPVARVGTSVTLTATVTAQSGGGTPAGTVTFVDGSSPISPALALGASNTVSYTASNLGPGAHVISAEYSGDGVFAPSTAAYSLTITGGAPSVALTPGGQQLVFWQGTDDHLWESWFSPGYGWAGPVDWTAALGGTGSLASAPSVVLTPGGQQLVFWQGTNDHLWEAWFTPGVGWYGPVDWTARLGGGGLLGSAPTVALSGGQQLVFWQGADDHLWEAWFSQVSGWAGPVDWTAALGGGGLLGSAPTVALSGGQQLVFWQGTDDNLWEAWFTAGVGWNGPADWTERLGGGGLLGSAPSVTLTGGQQLVFWQGTDDHLWEAWFTAGAGWSGPVDWTARLGGGGLLGSAPSVTLTGGQQLVFWQGTDGHLWEAWFSGRWFGPTDLTPNLSGSGTLGTAPQSQLDGGQQLVFWQSPDTYVQEVWFAGRWYGPANVSAG